MQSNAIKPLLLYLVWMGYLYRLLRVMEKMKFAEKRSGIFGGTILISPWPTAEDEG